jgi:hypothetical protein
MLKWCYILLFTLEVLWLIRTCCRKGKFWPVLTVNVLSAALSAVLLWYYDTLPGYGIMPGFAYFPEVFASLCAAAAFVLLTFVTLLCWLIRNHK